MSLFLGYVVGYLRGKGGPGLAEIAGGVLLFVGSLFMFMLV